MCWKDYLYFTRSERNGIKVLCLLLIILLFAPHLIRLIRPERMYDYSTFEHAVNNFRQQLADASPENQTLNSENHHGMDTQTSGATTSGQQLTDRSHQTGTDMEANLSPRPFNPNQLPAADWQAMGLPDYFIRTIHNYEAAGGSFRFKEDLRRIYLMKDEWFEQLFDYIELPERSETEKIRELAPEQTETSEPLLVNINRADTSELTQLRGIGPAFSRRIAEYRDRLGGFTGTDQLLEVYGMDSIRLEQFHENVLIDISAVRKINVHQADYITLVRHPYIDRNLANAILSFRDQHQPLDSLQQLRFSHLVTDEVYDRIAPYLTL